MLKIQYQLQIQRNIIQIMNSQFSVHSIGPFFEQIKDKLAKTITALESDEVIQQMRNDKTLYHFKLSHIKQIIDEHFSFQSELADIIQQNTDLKKKNIYLEQQIKNKEVQFSQSIDHIQQSAKLLNKIKEEQIMKLNNTIKELSHKLNTKSDANQKVTKKTGELSHKIQEAEQEKQKLKKQLNKFKDQNNKLLDLNKKLKISLKDNQNNHQKLIVSLKSEYQKQIQQYEILVKKMQNDMLIIKTQWQKKCNEVQKQLRDFYEGELMKLQEKKSRELIQHIQTLKQGKPVIIKHDQQILTSRVQSVRRQYENQIVKLQKNNEQLHQLYQNLQNAHIPKAKQMQTLSDALKTVRNQFQIQKQNWTAQKQKSKRQIQKLKAIVLQFERNNKDTLLSIQSKQAEIIKLNDNVKFIQKKLEIANRNIADQKNLITQKQDQLQMFKSKFDVLQQNNKKMKKIIDQLEAEKQAKTKKIQGLSKQIQKLNQRSQQLVQNLNNLKSQVKMLKSSKSRHKKIVDKLCIQVKHFQKQISLLKQDAKYLFELNRKKHFGDMEKLLDQIQIFRDNSQKQTKMKMNQLINEIQQAKQAEHAEFETILRQRQNLKREVAELQDLFSRKQKQVEDAKRNILNAQTDEVKRNMMEQLQRERAKYQRLEDQLIVVQKNHHRVLEKTKSQVKEAIRVLTSKWMEQISKLQQDNKRKQFQLQRIVDKVQSVIAQSQQTKKISESQKQQAKRYKKKYQIIKQQKQQQINDLMKRLERQSKHKINLQKELRSIRAQLNKGFAKDFSERQNKSIGNTLVTDREKQITQIRELIAKTYQVVGERPQKDNRIDRKRSPY